MTMTMLNRTHCYPVEVPEIEKLIPFAPIILIVSHPEKHRLRLDEPPSQVISEICFSTTANTDS